MGRFVEPALPVNAAPAGQNAALYAASRVRGVWHCVAVGSYTDAERQLRGDGRGSRAAPGSRRRTRGCRSARTSTRGPSRRPSIRSRVPNPSGDCLAVGSYSDIAGNGGPIGGPEDRRGVAEGAAGCAPANEIPSAGRAVRLPVRVACTGPGVTSRSAPTPTSADNHQAMVIRVYGAASGQPCAGASSLPSNADTTANRQNAGRSTRCRARAAGPAPQSGGYTDAGGGEEGLLLREANDGTLAHCGRAGTAGKCSPRRQVTRRPRCTRSPARAHGCLRRRRHPTATAAAASNRWLRGFEALGPERRSQHPSQMGVSNGG